MVDDAFRVLMIMSVPVFTFVLAALLYAIPRFRKGGEPAGDGPAIHTHGPTVATWFLATTALTLLVIVFPGTTGLLELRHHAAREPDLVVKVEGTRFFWKMTYPQQGVLSVTELVLPVGKRVRFEVTATDVVHSFWIPAFRTKIDAVPGLVTTTHVTPDKTGSFQEDSFFRLQCAELCGVAHSLMQTPVRVVEQSEFESWVAKQVPAPSS